MQSAWIVGEQLMNTEQCFHPIDMENWPGAQTFFYYTQMAHLKVFFEELQRMMNDPHEWL